MMSAQTKLSVDTAAEVKADTTLKTKVRIYQGHKHRLQAFKEGINQRNLKIWADVADKICFALRHLKLP